MCMRLWLFGSSWLCLAGCPEGAATAVPSTCETLHAQCRTPEGPLGVCSLEACGPGQIEPCYTCMSQH